MKTKNICQVRFRMGDIMQENSWKTPYVSEKTGVIRAVLYKLGNRPKAIAIKTLSGLCGGEVEFRFEQLLQERGWTQRYVSENCGLPPSTISRLANRPLAVWMETLGKLCGGLNINPVELFEVKKTGGGLFDIEDLFEIEK